MNKKRWNKEEKIILMENFNRDKNIYKKLDRSEMAINCMARRLKLYKETKYNSLINKFIEEYTSGKSTNYIAKKFRTSHSVVMRNLKKVGIKLRSISDSTKLIKRDVDGEKNPSWKGGLSYEPYNKEFNDKFKACIRKRDNQICMLCGIHREKLSKALQVHHIDYDKKVSTYENCISLCNKCHGKTNENRTIWKSFFQSLLTKRYDYIYLNEGGII